MILRETSTQKYIFFLGKIAVAQVSPAKWLENVLLKDDKDARESFKSLMPEVRNLSLVKHQHITGQICKGAGGFLDAYSLFKVCLLCIFIGWYVDRN